MENSTTYLKKYTVRLYCEFDDKVIDLQIATEEEFEANGYIHTVAQERHLEIEGEGHYCEPESHQWKEGWVN